MSDERVEGFANKETYGFEVNRANNKVLYDLTVAYAADKMIEDPEIADHTLGQAVVDMIKEKHDELLGQVAPMWDGMSTGVPLNPEERVLLRALRMLREDAGSWWRIDVAEVGGQLRDEVDQEGILK